MIGVILRTYREEHGLTLRQLTEQLGEHHSTVRLWRSGKRQPNLRQIRKIRRVADLPREQLLTEEKSWVSRCL